MSKRLFIGFKPHGIGEYAQFLRYSKKLKISARDREIGVKWVPLENLHITLNFLGEQPLEHVPLILEVMQEVAARHTAFELELRKVGAFPDEFQARVLWLGVTRSKYMVSLQEELQQLLEEKGFPVDEREFKPHLTIGRIRNARRVTDMIAPLVRADFGLYPVQHLNLFESVLRGAYPEYLPLGQASLKAQSA